MTDLYFKKPALLIVFWVLLALSACSGGQATIDGQVIPYNGVGLHQVTPQTTIISGNIKYKAYAGGDILVEARRSVPCAYGRCPVLGEPAVAEQKLPTPGAYSLQLPQSADGLMIIASFFPLSGGVRVAHTSLAGGATQISNVDLSLDRPYPPLR